MGYKIEINVHLPAVVVKKRRWYVASCPVLDVASQGDTAEKAKANLSEALGLFIMSCYERGVLSSVLEECGFKISIVNWTDNNAASDYVDVPIPLFVDAPIPEQCHA